MRDFLLFIPTPVRPHLGHLSTCLAAEARASGLSADELERRRGVFDEVKRFLEQRPGLEPDLRLQLFGSMVNGFAVPDSDVNIDVSDVQDRRQLLGRFLLKSYQAMKDFKTSSKSLVALEEHFMVSDGVAYVILSSFGILYTNQLSLNLGKLQPSVC